MNIWLVADTHFGHKKLVIEQSRPEGFEQKIIKSWRANVKLEDTIIHLGDLAFTSREFNVDHLRALINGLPGTKILVKGNHDHGSDRFYQSCGFSFVCNEFMLEKYGKRIWFVHCLDLSYFNRIVIHGHSHRKKEMIYNESLYPFTNTKTIQVNIVPEIIGYRVISLKEIIKKVENSNNENT